MSDPLHDDDVDLDTTGAGGDPDDDNNTSWKPPATQAELDRIIQKRLQRETARYRDYDTLRHKADQYDALAAASQTDQERAAAEAEEVGFNAAMSRTVPRLVRAEFRAAAKGLLSKDQLDTLLEDVDLMRYVDDEGEPDTEKIERKIAALAPKQGNPSFGQGNRGPGPKGRDMNNEIRRLAGFGA